MKTKEHKPKTKRAENRSLSTFQLTLIVIALAIVSVLIYKYFSSNTDNSGPVAAPSAVQNAPNAPAVYLNPQKRSYSKDTSFIVDVRENSGTTPVNAVEAVFSYPADKLAFVSIDGSSSPFKIEAQNNGGDGKISLTRGVIGSLTGDQLVAKITFKVSSAPTTADLSFNQDTALASALDNHNLITSLTDTHGAVYTLR